MKAIATLTFCVGIALVCSAWGADAPIPATQPGDATASAILHKVAIHVGVCVLPRVGDGVLAAALARQNAEVILGLAPDPAAADAARKPAAASNALGSQVVVETGNARAIPLQDWTADLLVAADATDANLADIPPAEVKRVLSPYRGMAVVGQPKGGKGGLTVAALGAWARQVSGIADVQQDDTGTWAVIKMPALDRTDDWSHYYHGPDGNPVSNDKVLAGPQFGLQWMGGPYWAGKFDVHVAAGGREFHAQSTIYWRTYMGLPYVMRARSLYNGQVLWERPIDPRFGDIGSLMVATPDRLYIKDGGSAEALDAETGNELIRYGNKDKDDCKWLMLSDGVLVTMNGPKRDKEWAFGTHTTFDQQQDYENATFYATEMDGWNAADGKLLWQFKEDRIDPAKTVIRDGHVYFYANYAYAACLDLKTGQQLWKTSAPIEEPKGPGMGLGWALNEIMTPRQSAIATESVYLINSYAHVQAVAFGAADGKLLWEKLKGKPTNDDKKSAPLLYANLLNYPIYFNGEFYDRWHGWDPQTGTVIPGPSICGKYLGCGHFTATTSGLMFGQCGGVFDKSDQQWDVNDTYTKAACGVSQFPADGVLVKVPADCMGCTEWRGFLVTRNSTASAPQGVRFEKGPAYDATPALTTSDAGDWPTYRGTVDRSASSAAIVPADAVLRWTCSRTPSMKQVDTEGSQFSALCRARPSPPIAVGNRAYFGTADGAVICLDAETGKEQWRYWTSGQIMSAPTWDGGRLYVGSSDGWVYCLMGDTGQLAWRYRVAPIDQQILVFGRLSSQWPVLANVLVHDGVAYAAGGLVNTLGGSVICAMDARTGQIKWEQDLTGDKANSAPSADGQLAYYHGKIWWHVAQSGVRVVDAETGKIDPVPDPAAFGATPQQAHDILTNSFNSSHGADIGILPGGWICATGNEFFLPARMIEEPGNAPIFMRTLDGVPQLETFTMVKSEARPCLPAWDAKAVFTSGGKWTSDKPPVPLFLWTHLSDALDSAAKAQPSSIPPPNQRFSLVREVGIVPGNDQGSSPMPHRLWVNKNVWWYSPMLSSNAAIALSEGSAQWTVMAFDRSDQTQLVRVRLPEKPIINGLALTHSGSILVSMENGDLVCIGANQIGKPGN